MEIPLQAQVECTDGICGVSLYVLINPVTEHVTHVVVRVNGSHTEYMVPVDQIGETIAGLIRLRCSKAELEKMEEFIKLRFIEQEVPVHFGGYGGYGMGTTFYWPYVTYTVRVPMGDRQIPAGELAINRGTRVEATDGYAGRVDELVVGQDGGRITHLVMREGHLWGQKDVIIPVSAIRETRDDTIFLKLDKQQIGAQATFPVSRRWS